jgi:hypothetical protein
MRTWDFLLDRWPPGQGGIKAMPRHPIQEIGFPPLARGRAGWLKDRILAVVAGGVPELRYHLGDPIRWRRRPGALPWWEARQRIGGRVTPEEFRRAVDELLAEGRLVEAWLERPDMRDGSHLLVMPGRLEALPLAVARSRGRADVLEREPWARSLRPGSADAPS